MDHTERSVTVPYRVHDDAHGKQIVDLVDRLALVHHLLVNGKQMLRASVDLGVNPRLADMHFHIAHDLIDKGLPFSLFQGDLLHEIIIDLGLEIFQGQIIKLNLDLADSETLGDRCIDLPCLPRLLLLLLRAHILERPHIVQPVGKLDEDDTDILRHRQEHLPEVLRLRVQLVGRIIQPSKLRHAIHQKRDLRPELFADLLLCHDRVFHNIVQKP